MEFNLEQYTQRKYNCALGDKEWGGIAILTGIALPFTLPIALPWGIFLFVRGIFRSREALREREEAGLPPVYHRIPKSSGVSIGR